MVQSNTNFSGSGSYTASGFSVMPEQETSYKTNGDPEYLKTIQTIKRKSTAMSTKLVLSKYLIDNYADITAILVDLKSITLLKNLLFDTTRAGLALVIFNVITEKYSYIKPTFLKQIIKKYTLNDFQDGVRYKALKLLPTKNNQRIFKKLLTDPSSIVQQYCVQAISNTNYLMSKYDLFTPLQKRQLILQLDHPTKIMTLALKETNLDISMEAFKKYKSLPNSYKFFA